MVCPEVTDNECHNVIEEMSDTILAEKGTGLFITRASMLFHRDVCLKFALYSEKYLIRC